MKIENMANQFNKQQIVEDHFQSSELSEFTDSELFTGGCFTITTEADAGKKYEFFFSATFEEDPGRVHQVNLLIDGTIVATGGYKSRPEDMNQPENRNYHLIYKGEIPAG